MTPSQWADLAGFAGSILILGAFARQTWRHTPPDVAHNLMNLAGAALLSWSLTVNYNLPALLLELAWAGIAAFGLVRLLAARP